MVPAPLAALPLAGAVTLVALVGHGLDLPVRVAALLALGAAVGAGVVFGASTEPAPAALLVGLS